MPKIQSVNLPTQFKLRIMKRFKQMQNELKMIENMEEEEEEPEQGEEEDEGDVNHIMTKSEEMILKHINDKLDVYQPFSDYMKANMLPEKNDKVLKLDEHILELEKLEQRIKVGKNQTTINEISEKFPDQNDLQFLTGYTEEQKSKIISGMKSNISKSIKCAKSRKIKEGMMLHFKKVLDYLNRIQNTDNIPFPLLGTSKVKIPIKIVNKGIPKGAIKIDLKRLVNCPEKRYFFIMTEITYNKSEFSHKFKKNDKNGEFNQEQMFILQSDRKLNKKIQSCKVKFILYKHHPFFSFNSKPVAEKTIKLDRLLNETNALYKIEFSYKTEINPILETYISINEAIEGNTTVLDLYDIQKKYPVMNFLSKAGKNTSVIML